VSLVFSPHSTLVSVLSLLVLSSAFFTPAPSLQPTLSPHNKSLQALSPFIPIPHYPNTKGENKGLKKKLKKIPRKPKITSYLTMFG
jgi:hypothetical protein